MEGQRFQHPATLGRRGKIENCFAKLRGSCENPTSPYPLVVIGQPLKILMLVASWYMKDFYHLVIVQGKDIGGPWRNSFVVFRSGNFSTEKCPTAHSSVQTLMWPTGNMHDNSRFPVLDHLRVDLMFMDASSLPYWIAEG